MIVDFKKGGDIHAVGASVAVAAAGAGDHFVLFVDLQSGVHIFLLFFRKGREVFHRFNILL